MTNYIILLPPSEGKTKGGEESKPFRLVQNLKKYHSYANSLGFDREFLYSSLREHMGHSSHEELERIFELKGDNLHNATDDMYDLLNLSTKPAIKRYSGVMYKAIDYEHLNEKQKENFNSATIIVDGLFGLLKPQDLIPNYKLKVTSSFDSINVANFWKERLPGIINAETKDKLVIDLLPETHKKAIDFDSNAKHITISFAKIKNKKVVLEGHNSKKLKGEFVKWLCSNNHLSNKDLKEFSHSQGYIFSEEHSSKNHFIYIKK